MPRRPLILSDQFPYHVTSRSNNKEWFLLPLEEAWPIFARFLREVNEKYLAHIYAFVLMSNHFHLILSTPQNNLGDVMRDFLTGVSKQIQQRTGRINHVFGARYKWTLLDSAYSVGYVTKYVFRNPVRAGICRDCGDYEYSSLNLKNSRLLPLVSGVGALWQSVPHERSRLLTWLNEESPKEAEKQIALGLRRARFQFSKDNTNQAAVRLLEESYGIDLKRDRYLSSLKGD
jgi:putative transposase